MLFCAYCSKGNTAGADEGVYSVACHVMTAGMGRYGQELGNIAAQALRQTNLLKKKCTNRTNKTVRQLRTARAPNCEAAEKAVEATRAAEKAVQNLAAFAGEPVFQSTLYYPLVLSPLVVHLHSLIDLFISKHLCHTATGVYTSLPLLRKNVTNKRQAKQGRRCTLFL